VFIITCCFAGPDNYWPCCNKKNQRYINWGGDASCPPLKCGDLSQEGKKACCTHKGYSQDPTCADDASAGTVSATDISGAEEEVEGPEVVCYEKNATMAAVAGIIEGAKADIEKSSKASKKVGAGGGMRGCNQYMRGYNQTQYMEGG
jgi:hypothetical protein